MALTQIKTTAIADDAVTTDKLANAINTERTANTAKVSLENDSVTGAKIADDAVGAEHIEVLDADLKLADNAQLIAGTGNDLRFYHNGNHSYISDVGTGVLHITSNHISLLSADTNEYLAEFSENAAVKLYYDNSKKFETYSGGVEWHGNLKNETDGVNEGIYLGAQNDFGLYHDGSNSFLLNKTGNLYIQGDSSSTTEEILIRPKAGEQSARFIANGAVELYYDNSKKIETQSWGVNTYGALRVTGAEASSAWLTFQADEGDDNSDIFGIEAVDGGPLKIQNKTSGSWETSIEINGNGNVELYYDGSKKIETYSHGMVVSGYLQAYTNISDSGHSTSAAKHVIHSDVQNQAVCAIEHSHDSNPYGLYVTFSDTAPDNHTSWYIACEDSALRFIVYSDGDVRNHDNSYGAISDVKLKENIVDANSQWDDVKAVKVRNFNFKSDSPSDKRLGVVAQELETISPGLVDNDPDLDADNQPTGTTTKAVKYSILYMKAFKALQEAIARIETLETEVAALKG